MYVPLGIKTDYSLLQSLIKIKNLINYLVENNYTTVGIIDDNMSSTMEFYNECKNNNIKPIIGLSVKYNDLDLYLYAKNYEGLLELYKLNTIKQTSNLSLLQLEECNNIICVIPFKSNILYKDLNSITDCYISYGSNYEKENALIITKNIVFINEIYSLNKTDLKLIDYLKNIGSNNTISNISIGNYENNYILDIEEDSTNKFSELINIEIPKNKRYIPVFKNDFNDSYKYLVALSKKGLEKRLDSKVSNNYYNRLKHELEVINDMGFSDYFLIVYDYVKYAKSHDILVGPGRGSAAGSLVSYSLGITEVDPLKYNLLFERFLDKNRISMPDIDIDFEFTKRDEVIKYVIDKYGNENVAPIMTYGTLASKQVIRDVFKILEMDDKTTSVILSKIDASKSLKDNIKDKNLMKIINDNKEIKKAFNICIKFEGLKKYISTHAAGIVICSESLNDIIPIIKNDNNILTGFTMEYLEELGLLKMDFLALKNLTIISNILKILNNKLKPSDIDLDDEKTYKLFYTADTEGVFQFETNGMKNFLRKLKPTTFNDLVASLALFRPGPMGNIDSFISRKNGLEKTTYLDSCLEPVLKETYGIIVYQEQILEILKIMGGYSYSEADLIRRAMSKKKKDVMENERTKFINNAVLLGHNEEVSNKVYDLISKFAEYGFNKAHSVSYALIGYYLAYLKSNYTKEFLITLLNMSIGSEIKTKEYIELAKKMNIKILKPDINLSELEYMVEENNLRFPLSIIKNVGKVATSNILEERNKNKFADFHDFVARNYGKGVTKRTIESLIDSDAFSSFGYNHQTLHNNIDSMINYAELISDLDESLVLKPTIEVFDEYEENIIIGKELEVFGFYSSNHPVTKYNTDSIKVSDINKHYDKYIDIYIMITNISKIKTKNNEDMAFITGEDETGSLEFIAFKDIFNKISELKTGDILLINGHVEKRYDKYQVIIKKIVKR